jgi:hypothetical protein
MTISEAISKLRYELNKNNKMANAYAVAIDTMRKYQKIQEILNSTGYIEKGIVYAYTYNEDTRVKHIRKVVEDGTN